MQCTPYRASHSTTILAYCGRNLLRFLFLFDGFGSIFILSFRCIIIHNFTTHATWIIVAGLYGCAHHQKDIIIIYLVRVVIGIAVREIYVYGREWTAKLCLNPAKYISTVLSDAHSRASKIIQHHDLSLWEMKRLHSPVDAKKPSGGFDPVYKLRSILNNIIVGKKNSEQNWSTSRNTITYTRRYTKHFDTCAKTEHKSVSKKIRANSLFVCFFCTNNQ